MTDPVSGKTLHWTYDDGPVAGKQFTHRFGTDGTVVYQEHGGAPSQPVKYEVADVADGVYAVSYLASSGWTLTTVVDPKTKRIVSFASNEKSLVVQRGKLV